MEEDIVKICKPHGTYRCLCASFVAVMLLVANPTHAQVRVTTVAGGFINDGQPATSSALQSPEGGRMDKAGNLYIADQLDHRLRKVSTTGVITTIAGTGIAGYSGDGGPAASAQIRFPVDVVIDSEGDIIFSDSGNNRIRKINSSGIITTIAGTGVAGFSGDGGPATSAKLNHPKGLNLDSAGDLYFADNLNQRIRKIDTGGIIHSVAGNGTAGFAGDGRLATSAELNSPDDVLPDSSGNFYISDHDNRRVRKVSSSGIISTFAGNGSGGCAGDGGPATSASLGRPTGLLIYSGRLVGNLPTLLIGNACQARIRGVNLSTNIIHTFVGSLAGFDGNRHLALSSQFLSPGGVMVDNSGDLLIGDAGNDEVRKVAVGTTLVTAFAGGYLGNGGLGTLASLNDPENIAFDKSGNLYIVEANGNRIRKLSTTGVILPFAGTGISGYSGDGGKATAAQLWFPYGVAADNAGNVYIADTGNNIIRKVTAGIITTFARDSRFGLLAGLATDSEGNVYAADNGACVVWHITPTGTTSIFAGVLNTCGYNSDGIAATSAQLNNPYAVAVDSKNNLFIGDSANNRVREVSAGIISTFAGKGTCGFSGDTGPAKSAQVCYPTGVGVDANFNVYIGDDGNSRVRKVNGTGTISTYAGTIHRGYNGDGLASTKTNLDSPISVAVNPSGIPYVADDVQYRVRKIQ